VAKVGAGFEGRQRGREILDLALRKIERERKIN
jgi:hypothetical protein